MKDLFRHAGAVSEFYDELDGLKKSQVKIIVWQTDKTGNRKTCDGTVKSFLANKKQTVINLFLDKSPGFNDNSAIFIYEEEKGILFKGTYDHFVNNNLKLIADEKVFLKEKRKCERIHFQYTKVFVNLKYNQSLDFNKLKLKDISRLGFSITVNDKITNLLEIGTDLSMISINEIDIPVSLEGVIVHKTVQDKRGGIYTVGVKFKVESKLLATVVSSLEEYKKSN